MRAGKDSVLFRLASVAYSCGFTPNVVTALGLCFGVASGVMFSYRAFVFAFGFGFLSVFCSGLSESTHNFPLEILVLLFKL